MKKTYILRQERYAGTTQRSFCVGEGMTEDDIKAKYENGVLSLMIPQKDPPKGLEKKQILIEGLTHAASPQSGSYEPDYGLVFILALGSAFQ